MSPCQFTHYDVLKLLYDYQLFMLIMVNTIIPCTAVTFSPTLEVDAYNKTT